MAETAAPPPPPSTYHLDPTDPDFSASFPAVEADFLAALPADPDLTFDFDFDEFDFDEFDFDLGLDARTADCHPSPESGNSGGGSSGSAVVDNPSGPQIRSDSKSESGGLKRKAEGEDVVAKAARVGGYDEEGRRRARLLRNRESAQLSRQRRKQYVEALEEKVRSLTSTIAELRGRLSFSLAENTSLRHQLFATAGPAAGGPGGVVYPPAAVNYPWYPAAPLIVPPRGSQVPLLPIPRIRPQKSSPVKKSAKTKKVASVTFLGLLFFLLLFGGLVPFVTVRYGSVTPLSRLNYGNGVVVDGNDRSRGRVLAVREPKGVVGMEQGRQDRSSWKSSNASGEPLLASLYVPRNDKMVKIDGNLIIHSVIASEKAGGSEKSVSERKGGGGESTGLVVHGDLGSALVVSNQRAPHSCRGSSEKLGELGSGSWDECGDEKELSASEGPLQRWFREGLAGPIMSSGMCTEVFRFEVSPNPGAIVSTSSVGNTSNSNPGYHAPRKTKNRRILYSPMPLHSTSFQKTNETPPEPTNEGKLQGNSSASTSMVVSVLLDPNEAGDIGSMVSPKSKSLSRIFVVVLLDSVKYVTYSCVLPIKGSGPQLVRN